ncbi:hypothetical protein ACFT5B_11830 [Luteimicrobium sp. NPDC057192]|uniref:hypothetical protein n=1 Tax=Luteimicrobium sp. NPDC057192 TaxID=3346042 RepID=UPI0036399296
MTATDLTVMSAPLPERMEYAKALAASNLLPQAFRQQPANALVAIEYGNALGIAPIVALSEINVINGTPSLSAALMASLARAAGHKVRTSGDAESATCTIERADDPGYEHTATWTKKKAQDASLWGRGHWAKDPGTMLRWRAISECVRFACPEVLAGIKYTPEEIVEFSGVAAPAPVQVQARQADRPRSGNARLAAAVQDHPAATAPVEDVQDAEVVEEPGMTQAQSRKMGALMRELDLSDREIALAYVSGTIGRDVASRSELTKDEAGQVIDSLESDLEAQKAKPEPTEALDAEADAAWIAGGDA